MTLAFEKWHGLGNDFVVVRNPPDFAAWRQVAVAVCDRRYGVGADGVLLADASSRTMQVINSDGSTPEMCGNGLRCVVASWMRASSAERFDGDVTTGAGVLRVSGAQTRAGLYEVSTSLGIPRWGAGAVDVVGEGERLHALDDALRGDAPGWLVSMGNPHWVHLETSASIDEIGEKLALDERFANGTNVEFVTPRAAGGYRVDVWERGCGRTLACGTGAAASLAVLTRVGLAPVDEDVTLELPGGVLTGRTLASGEVVLRGPAALVFEGALPSGWVGRS